MGRSKKFKKIRKRINKHLRKVAEHNKNVFTLITQIDDRGFKGECEYESLRKLLDMYKENQETLNKVVNFYESKLEDYDYSKKENKAKEKGKAKSN